MRRLKQPIPLAYCQSAFFLGDRQIIPLVCFC